MRLYDKIIEAVKATGAEAKKTGISAGLYYDGTQHGEIIDAVYITISRYTAGHYNGDAARIAGAARKAAGRFKGVSIKEVDHPGFYIYIVTTTTDRERADKLQREADAFLDAYHEEIHRQRVTGEPENIDKAHKAGNDAIKALKAA